MADSGETSTASSKKDKKKNKKKQADSGTEENPSTSGAKEDGKKKKKEKSKKNDKKKKGNSGNQSEEEGNAPQSGSLEGASASGIHMDETTNGPDTEDITAAPQSKKDKKKSKQKATKSENEEDTLSTSSTNQGSNNKKKKKEKEKKSEKKKKGQSGNQSQEEGNSFQDHSLGGATYSGVQIDDFQEPASCFPYISNPLKKKHGYDFASIAEGSSIHYQEVPVSIERSQSKINSVMEVTVTPKEDGSLPAMKAGPPPQQYLVEGSARYPDTMSQGATVHRREEITVSSGDEVKKLEEKIKQLEKENKSCEAAIREHKTQVVKLTKERDDAIYRLSKEWDEKISADESNVENINIKNRPLKLAKEFALIAASEWLEAKGALDQYSDMSEYDKLTLLCDIMLQAEDITSLRYKEILEGVTLQIQKPFSYQHTAPPIKTNGMPIASPKTTSPQNGQDGKLSTVELKKGQNRERNTLTESVALDQLFNDSTMLDSATLVTSNGDKNSDKGCTSEQTITKHQNLSDHGSVEENTNSQDSNMDDVSDRKNRDYEQESNSKGRSDYQAEVPSASTSVNTPSENKTPKANSSKSGSDARVSGVQVPQQLEVVTGDIMRKASDSVDVTAAIQAITGYIERAYTTSLKEGLRLVDLKDIQTYIEVCLQFAWKMTIQRPRMVFSVDGVGGPWIEQNQDPCHASDNPNSQSAVVLLYRYPQLFHAGKLLVKGSVLIQEQTEYE